MWNVANQPNERLRRARESQPSPAGADRAMSRQELADLVNGHLYRTTNSIHSVDANYIGKLERGCFRWPSANYRAALRAVLHATTDSELGFYTTGRTNRPTGRQTETSFPVRTERPVGLRPHVEAAFLRNQVTLDFAGFSGETLHGALLEPVDKIRAGVYKPDSIAIRILLPDAMSPMALPCRVDTQVDDPAVRERAARIVRRHTESIAAAIRELAELKLVSSATVNVRTHRAGPLFKLLAINRKEVFFGFYPVTEHVVTIGDQDVEIYDPMGKDVTLFHWVDNDDNLDSSLHVKEACRWFESVWAAIARDYSI